MNRTVRIENRSTYESVLSAFRGCDFGQTELSMSAAIDSVIEVIPSTTPDFVNRGVFSTHYLQNRLFDELKNRDIEGEAKALSASSGARETLRTLGWNVGGDSDTYFLNTASGNVAITITDAENFGISQEPGRMAPSYAAVAELKRAAWSVLTNGRLWRLYTDKVSASTTNYFEVNLDNRGEFVTRYLAAIFGKRSHDGKELTAIEMVLGEGWKKARELQDNLTERIQAGGIFLDLVKGVLGHDMKTEYHQEDLDSAKDYSMKILYRIWFLLYAESRDLLPVGDEKYKPISLEGLKNRPDSMETKPEESKCWEHLLKLFGGIRDGDSEHNLPQYDGELFAYTRPIDGITIKNKFMVRVLRGLIESEGLRIDYGSLGVRHLGTVYESLMEFTVKQAEERILVLEGGNGIQIVQSDAEATYSYDRNDLYLSSKGGIASRKTSASYYTSDRIVKFLTRRGLEPILQKREDSIGNDLRKYDETKSEEDRNACVDRLLDIQVLDPAMGSGHFLVEALNQITNWATGMLNRYPKHPVVDEIEKDRQSVIDKQRSDGVAIDEGQLTQDVLLKRRIMKRCIFGVDLNPLAVELAKLSLWLDSFAIGVPLTYMDHHIKVGDSVIGMWMKDRKKNVKDQSLDAWMGGAHRVGTTLHDVSHPADVTIDDLKKTKRRHENYEAEIRPYKKILDVLAAKLMDQDIARNAPQDLAPIFDIACGRRSGDERHDEVVSATSERSRKYRFFHWELEMMDAFTDSRRGFDLILGNPPWDKIRPNKSEFFGQRMPGYKKAGARKKKELHDKYEKEYETYRKGFDERRKFYKGRGGMGENTDYDAYRLVVERMLELLAEDGVMSIVAPSAIIISKGATEIRKHVLERKIVSLYEFENRKKLFDIDSRSRFVLLTMQNTESTVNFPVAFFIHDVGDLDNIDEKSFELSKDDVKNLSPKMLMICDFRSQKDMKIALRLFSSHKRLEEMEGWSVALGRELAIGEQKDRKLLTDNRNGSWPVMEAKNFHQHIWDFSRPANHARTRETLRRTARIHNFQHLNGPIHDNPRLVYREVSSSTNTRTMIASIIPPSIFTTKAAFMAIPSVGELRIDQNYHRLDAYLCGIFNSLTFDYLIRPKVDKSVETYHIYDTIVPGDFKGETAGMIGRLSASLFLSDTWHEGLADTFSIRRDDMADLTLQRRLDITAEIDALVAIHYGLTCDEYETVLANFAFDESGLTNEELESSTTFSDLDKSYRDRLMRRFFGEVRKSATRHYEDHVGSGRKTDAA